MAVIAQHDVKAQQRKGLLHAVHNAATAPVCDSYFVQHFQATLYLDQRL